MGAGQTSSKNTDTDEKDDEKAGQEIMPRNDLLLTLRVRAGRMAGNDARNRASLGIVRSTK